MIEGHKRSSFLLRFFLYKIVMKKVICQFVSKERKKKRNIVAKIQFCFFSFLLTLKIIIEKKINYMFDMFYCLLYNIYLFSALIKKAQRFSRSMIHLIRIWRGNSRFYDLHGLKFTLIYVSCHFRKIMKLFIGLLYYVICDNISFI
jgi:hypothetical protein